MRSFTEKICRTPFDAGAFLTPVGFRAGPHRFPIGAVYGMLVEKRKRCS
ncbi:Uncharacterised protein [[Flavobacterium] thermophilum]|nr:Uncharacterised protein [[Flavobacterium] thermophilum]